MKTNQPEKNKIITVTLILLFFFMTVYAESNIDCNSQRETYFNCINECYTDNFNINFSCLDECNVNEISNECKNSWINNFVILNCSEGKFLPGKYSDKSCTITKNEAVKTFEAVYRQTIYSYGKVIPAFIFDKFEIKDGIELRVLEKNKAGCGGGSGKGGKGGAAKEGKGEKGNGKDGGEGGRGANLTSPAFFGKNSSSEGCAIWGEPGGRIFIAAKNFTITNGSINADGEYGYAGFIANCENKNRGINTKESGATGGDGGGGGGLVFIVADHFYNNGSITARGGVGGAGGEERDGYGGGGGGGGGDGGMIILDVINKENEGILDVSGGKGGCWKFENGCKVKMDYYTEGDDKCTMWKIGGRDDTGCGNVVEGCNCEEIGIKTEIENFLQKQKNVREGKDPEGAEWRQLLFGRYSAIVRILNNVTSCKYGSKDAEERIGGPGENGADGKIMTPSKCTFKKLYEKEKFIIKFYDPGDFWCDFVPGYNFESGNDLIGSSHWVFHCEEDGKISELSGEGTTRNVICKQLTEKDIETIENRFDFCLNEKVQSGCEKFEFCKWESDRCVSKYPPYGKCELGNNITSISTKPNDFNSTSFYQSYASSIISSIDKKQKQNLINFCSYAGDCGNRKHFISDIQTTDGYSFIVFPPVNGKASVLFRCERVISNYNDTGKNCELCNPGNIEKYFGYHRSCSRYNCESLGSNCVWDGEKKVCSAQYNYSLPKMQSIEFRDNYGLCSAQSNLDRKEINITCKTANFCIHPNSISEMSYSFDREVICRMALYNAAHASSSDLSGEWANMITASDSDFFQQSHGWHIPPPLFTVPSDVSDKLDVKAYLLCKDRFNNTNTYTINFCISKADVNPPLIETSLHSGDEVRQGTNQLKIFVNEPIDTCSWSTNDGQSGNLALSNFTYNTAGWLESQISFNMPLKNLEMKIQCNDTSGNANSITLTFKPLVYQLNVLLTAPERVVDCKKPKINLDIAIGSDAGPQTATCNIYRNGTLVETVRGESQYSVAIEVENGMNIINVTCTNPSQLVSASNTTTVTALISPQIGFKKFYLEGESLKIETDSVATCYKLDACPTEGMIPNPLDLIKSNLIDPFSKNTQLHTLQVPFDGSRHAQFCVVCRNNCGNITSQMIHVIK
jgi:hypothetical protein